MSNHWDSLQSSPWYCSRRSGHASPLPLPCHANSVYWETEGGFYLKGSKEGLDSGRCNTEIKQNPERPTTSNWMGNEDKAGAWINRVTTDLKNIKTKDIWFCQNTSSPKGRTGAGKNFLWREMLQRTVTKSRSLSSTDHYPPPPGKGWHGNSTDDKVLSKQQRANVKRSSWALPTQ